MATIQTKNTKFVDIDLNFSLHPISGDIGKRVDVNAIINAVKTLVRTRQYDRLFHPEMYCQVSDMLFEQITPGTSVIIERMIKHVIENYEPRVEVISVDVTAYPDENHIYVELKFIIVGTIETITTNFFLERTL
jgi:phage baseplate assembly protein W